MCGIAGIIASNPELIHTSGLKAMTDTIAHRGPDGEGHWISSNGKVGLGHRRLSIIDLSHEADQPMHYMDRYSIVFNGEIYNYVELKENLLKEGYHFKTQSDTEVLMALYHKHGEKCLGLLDGMFAFVLYDAETNTAFCARDRFGEKPFFYNYKKGEYFYFGSEMKCLWAGGTKKETNNRMLFNYLAYGFLDNPTDARETFFNHCNRLPHAHYMKIAVSTLEVSIHKYYDIDWKHTDHSISVEQASERFRELFDTSVKRRLRSDVTVGSSLSGGLDSSLVVCVIDALKKGTSQKQNTFSAVFPGFKKDERKYMDYVIAKTNVEPHFVTPNDEDMIRDLDKLSWHQEEPFGSASIYVQYRVMQLAKEHNVTVLLDGQGADEILAGYHPYYITYFQELKRANKQQFKKELVAYKLIHSGSTINDSILGGWKNIVKGTFPGSASLLRKYHERYKQFRKPFFNHDFFNAYFKESFERKYEFSTLNESLYHSTIVNGLQELLRYADRNSMAHSREVRLPFLNHELVEFLFSLPSDFKIRNGWTKWIMREATQQILPTEIGWRKDKIGYEPPQASWMTEDIVKSKIQKIKSQLINQNLIDSRFLNSQIKSENPGQYGIFWKLLSLNNEI